MKKPKGIDLSEAQSAYQFPYIAVMTIFCMFFLMMYVFYYKVLEDVMIEREEVSDTVQRAVKADKGLDSSVKAEKIKDGVKLILPSALVFPLGSADIRPGFIPVLSKIADVLKTMSADYKVEVEGHTDDAPVWYGGNFNSNRELSTYRALSIVEYFIKDGISQERFTAKGRGEYAPAVKNDSLAHRAANRRVEIIIRPKKQAPVRGGIGTPIGDER